MDPNQPLPMHGGPMGGPMGGAPGSEGGDLPSDGSGGNNNNNNNGSGGGSGSAKSPPDSGISSNDFVSPGSGETRE